MIMASPKSGVPKIDFELLEGSFIFLGLNELLTTTENVEEWGTFIS